MGVYIYGALTPKKVKGLEQYGEVARFGYLFRASTLRDSEDHWCPTEHQKAARRIVNLANGRINAIWRKREDAGLPMPEFALMSDKPSAGTALVRWNKRDSWADCDPYPGEVVGYLVAAPGKKWALSPTMPEFDAARAMDAAMGVKH